MREMWLYWEEGRSEWGGPNAVFEGNVVQVIHCLKGVTGETEAGSFQKCRLK